MHPLSKLWEELKIRAYKQDLINFNRIEINPFFSRVENVFACVSHRFSSIKKNNFNLILHLFIEEQGRNSTIIQYFQFFCDYYNRLQVNLPGESETNEDEDRYAESTETLISSMKIDCKCDFSPTVHWTVCRMRPLKLEENLWKSLLNKTQKVSCNSRLWPEYYMILMSILLQPTFNLS